MFLALASRVAMWPNNLAKAQSHCPLMPQSHQTFRSVLAVKLLGIMLRNRWWPTTFLTIPAGDADKWCRNCPVWSAPQQQRTRTWFTSTAHPPLPSHSILLGRASTWLDTQLSSSKRNTPHSQILPKMDRQWQSGHYPLKHLMGPDKCNRHPHHPNSQVPQCAIHGPLLDKHVVALIFSIPTTPSLLHMNSPNSYTASWIGHLPRGG